MDVFGNILISAVSILGAIILVGIIIMAHELGHYSIGRLCKIKIVEFAVGFGPKIKSWVKNGIIYSIRWLPLGGFTKFYGEDEETKDTDSFNSQPPGKRALTIAAGPIFNIILAVIIAVVFLMAFGEYNLNVADVWEGSPAQEAGLMEGDVITSLNGSETEFYWQMGSAVQRANNESLSLTVLRDGQELSFDIQKEYYDTIPEANRNGRTDEDMVVNNYMAGLTFGSDNIKYGFFESIAMSFRWTFLVLKETLLAVVGIFTGRGTDNVSSIVVVVQELAFALKNSFEGVLKLCAAINISLAVINLLPLPALDGGRLVFIGIEKIFRKPVPRKVEGMIHFVGFVLLVGAMLLIVFRDIF